MDKLDKPEKEKFKMFKIYNNEPYQIKTSEKLTKELKKELSEKIKIKISFLFWYIADKAKEYGLDLDISAYIIDSGRVSPFFIDKNSGAMFDCTAFPLALWISPVFKYNKNNDLTGIESVEIKTADVDNWTDYFKTFRDVKNRIGFLPKSRGVR